MLTMVCTQVCNFVSTNRKEVANMKRIFIVGAKRTPIGKFGGSLSTFSASELGAKVISAVLKQSKLPKEKILYDYKLTPLAEWIDSSLVGLEPRLMGIGPEIAVKKLLTQQKMDITDIDIFELNEAFAAQSIACIRQLGINDMDKVNPKGGAIALGHPVGASGSRILTTLIYELIENKGNYGIASLCIGGGMGAATLIKNANSNL